MNTDIKPVYLDLPSVAVFVALSETTVQKLVREKTFPQPRMISAHRVAWLTREVEEWAQARPVSALLPPPKAGARKARQKPAKRSQAVQDGRTDV